MSKKFNKIMGVVLALMMVCSLLPMSAMAAEGFVDYTISPGSQANEYANRAISRSIPEQYISEITLPVTTAGIQSEFGWAVSSDIEFVRWINSQGQTIEPDETLDEEGKTNGRTVPFLPEDGETYTAIWSSDVAERVTVTLHPGKAGGVAVPGEPVSGGEFVKGAEYYGPAESPFAYEGYEVIGWNTDEDATTGIAWPLVLNDNTDLYAIWVKLPESEYWTVTFMPGEGAAFRQDLETYEYDEDGNIIGQAAKNRKYNLAMLDANETEVVDNVPQSVLFSTIPEGMEFAGWRLNDSETTYYSGQVVTVTANSTFTATWRPEGTGPYNLIYNAGQLSQYRVGDEVRYNRDHAVTVEAGGSQVLPESVEAMRDFGWTIPEGYTFNGWVNADNEVITSVSGMSEDVTVIARWNVVTGHTWTVTFEGNGGTGKMEPVELYTSEDTYEYRLPYPDFTAPDGMEFDYWTVSGMEGQYHSGDTITVSSDITLTANWRKIEHYSYLVTFDANGGTGTMEPVVVEGTTSELSFTAPECSFEGPDGAPFEYWLVEETGEIWFAEIEYTISSSVTLVAQWAEAEQSRFFG